MHLFNENYFAFFSFTSLIYFLCLLWAKINLPTHYFLKTIKYTLVTSINLAIALLALTLHSQSV